MNVNANRPSDSDPDPRTSPILNHDILLSIFKMNTDIFLVEKGCLRSLRHYSQICTDWRVLILQTPSLWGQTIDFDELLETTLLWRDEVLRRSQDSLLWIKGSLKGPAVNWKLRQHLEVAYTVLDIHWARIEKLHLEMPYRTSIDLVKWSSLWSRPSPCLRVFRLKTKRSPRRRTLLSTGSIATSPILFADNAPALLEYHANPLIGFKLDAPWLKHIYVLHLEGPNTLPSIFQTIQAAPLLEVLHISCFFSAGMSSYPSPRVDLLYAKELHISGYLSSLLVILEHLEIPNSCAIQLTISEFSDSDDVGVGTADLTHFISLAHSIRGYLEQHQPLSVSIAVSCQEATPTRTGVHTFSFSDISTPWMRTLPCPIVSVSIHSNIANTNNSADIILKYILDQYQSLPDNPSARRVTHLDLTIDTSSSPSSLFTLAPLLSSLSSVKVLRMSDRITLNPDRDILENVHIDPIFDILFPSLKKIKLSLLFIQPKSGLIVNAGLYSLLLPTKATESEEAAMQFVCTRSSTGWMYDFVT